MSGSKVIEVSTVFHSPAFLQYVSCYQDRLVSARRYGLAIVPVKELILSDLMSLK